MSTTEALDATELAAQMRLHVTTVRFVSGRGAAKESLSVPGSHAAALAVPRTGYLAVRIRLDYQSLAEILGLELGDPPASGVAAPRLPAGDGRTGSGPSQRTNVARDNMFRIR